MPAGITLACGFLKWQRTKLSIRPPHSLRCCVVRHRRRVFVGKAPEIVVPPTVANLRLQLSWDSEYPPTPSKEYPPPE